MLMMGFFVILWVLKPSPSPKTDPAANQDWIKVAAAIRDAFGYVPKAGSSDPVDIQMILQQMSQPRVPVGPGEGGKTTVRPDGAKGTDPEVQSIRTGKQTVVGGRLQFQPGDARLSPLILNSLDQIADQIRGHLNVVLVKGHTALDDFDDTATPEQKLDLSIRRAQAVCDYLTRHGVDPQILRVQGCSTFEPVVQREYEPDSQELNRRVEVESTPTLVKELQSHANAGGGGATTAPSPAATTQP
jgi:outer membrane protein OmpA-like peptidoglycan-associated protein